MLFLSYIPLDLSKIFYSNTFSKYLICIVKSHILKKKSRNFNMILCTTKNIEIKNKYNII